MKLIEKDKNTESDFLEHFIYNIFKNSNETPYKKKKGRERDFGLEKNILLKTDKFAIYFAVFIFHEIRYIELKFC